MKLVLRKKLLLTFVFLYILAGVCLVFASKIFFLKTLIELFFLSKLFVFFHFFIVPGFLFYLLFFHDFDLLKALPFITGISVSAVICTLGFLSFFMNFSTYFQTLLVVLPALIPAFLMVLRKKNSYTINFRPQKELVFIFLLIIITRLLVFFFLKGSTIGGDITRFAINSHAMFLKGTLTADLTPYSEINGFFYFPGAFTLPLSFEIFGFDPISAITLTMLVFQILSPLLFFYFVRQFFSFQASLSMLFFYSFVFDIIFIYSTFGLFPFAFSLFFLLAFLVLSASFFLKGKTNFFALSACFFGMIAFHFYSLIIAGIFFLAFMTYKSITRPSQFLKALKPFALSGILALFLLLPFFIVFGKYMPESFNTKNYADLLTNISPHPDMSFLDKLKLMFLNPPFLPVYSPFFYAGLVFLALAFIFKKFKHKQFFMVFFFFLAFFNFFAIIDNNLLRLISFSVLFYSIGLGLFFEDLKKSIILFFILPFVISPSVFYWVGRFALDTNHTWVLYNGFFEAMSFIENNVPENAVFLIDGGGSGCTGGSRDQGEKIFPLTSRKIFYYTDSCWAYYNFTEYQDKVMIYNSISINPDNGTALNLLKNFNVTHVFIGSESVGLRLELFQFSNNYLEVFSHGDAYVFEIV